MTDSALHEARSQALADSIRRFLVAVHTGGIATTFAVASSLVDNRVHPGWAFWPVALFAFGLVLAAISMLLAQHREMKWRDAAERGVPYPKFNVLWWSWPWNWLSLVVFVVAVGVGLCGLSNISI